MTELKVHKYIQLSELCSYFDEKYNQSNYLSDLLNQGEHFYQWCDQMGYVDTDPKGNRRGASQLWFKEYREHPQGKSAKPERLNFIDFMVNEQSAVHVFYVYHRDCYPEIPWVNDICNEICDICGPLLGSEEDIPILRVHD